MIFPSEKIFFLHPGKTGGTSIESALVKKIYKQKFIDIQKKYSKSGNRSIMFGFDISLHIYLQHCDLRLASKLGINVNQYHTICTVRNPIHRLLSAYFYSGKDKKDFNSFISEDLQILFERNLSKGYTVNFFGPQHWYTSFNNYNVDTTIHLEDINNQCKEINLDLDDHMHAKTRASIIYPNYIDAYRDKSLRIVYDLYKEDFKRFNYK